MGSLAGITRGVLSFHSNSCFSLFHDLCQTALISKPDCPLPPSNHRKQGLGLAENLLERSNKNTERSVSTAVQLVS